jgi:hypothetical protein
VNVSAQNRLVAVAARAVRLTKSDMWTITLILLCLDAGIPLIAVLGLICDAYSPESEMNTFEKFIFFLMRLWAVSFGVLTPIFGFANALYWYKCCPC